MFSKYIIILTHLLAGVKFGLFRHSESASAEVLQQDVKILPHLANAIALEEEGAESIIGDTSALTEGQKLGQYALVEVGLLRERVNLAVDEKWEVILLRHGVDVATFRLDHCLLIHQARLSKEV